MQQRISSVLSTLWPKILVTLAILAIYRAGSFIPVPYIDVSRLFEISDYTSKGVFGMFNMLSGGSLSRMSIFAIGVVPYITASIVVQLIFSSFESLKKIKQEGEDGQIRIHQYTRYLCFFVAMFQGFSIATGLSAKGIILDSSSIFLSKLWIALTFTTGTFLLVWLGKQITLRGIGNGVSLIIFVGIISEFPTVFVSAFELLRTGSISAFGMLLFIGIFFGSIYVVVLFEKSYKIIKVTHPSQGASFANVGRGAGAMMRRDISELPLKVNPSGVVPAIFASSILLLPTTILSFIGNANNSAIISFLASNLAHGRPLFVLFYFVLILFFTFFYSEIVSNPKEISDRFMKANYFINGVRPGLQTQNFLKSTISRLCLIGGSYLAVVCIAPEVASSSSAMQGYMIGGTSVLIIVGVVNDLVEQIYMYSLSGKYSKVLSKKKSKNGKSKLGS